MVSRRLGRARLKSLPEPLVTQAPSALLGNLLIRKVKQEGGRGGLCSREDGVTWFPYSSPVWLKPWKPDSTHQRVTAGGRVGGSPAGTPEPEAQHGDV